MTEPSSSTSNTDDPRLGRILEWASIPLAFFPAVALLTYDWHAVESLQSPAAPSTNWIGALGDAFAYHGYLLLGFAIWLVPVVCLATALRLPFKGRGRITGRHVIAFTGFIAACACLLQVAQNHFPGLAVPLERTNTINAGGAVGYILMTSALMPLIGDFGSAVAMIIVAAVSFICMIGPRRLLHAVVGLSKWIACRDADRQQRQNEEDQDREEDEPGRDIWQSFPAMAPKAERPRAARLSQQQQPPPPPPKRAASERPSPAARPAPPAVPAKKTAPVERPDPDGPYQLPPLSLLGPIPKSTADHGDVGEMSKRLIDTLNLFGIQAVMSYTVEGPVVTKYAISLAPGTRYNAVTSLQNNLTGALHATSLRIEAPIPGQDCIGIEVPNRKPAGISFRQVIESDAWRNSNYELPLLFGKDAAGNDLVADLAKMPHMLVAGATGQGKSVCLNSIICGLLMTKTPEELKFIMVDPKTVEFKSYERLPHLLVPIINDNAKTERALAMAVIEMEKRLKMFSKAKVRNIKEFNSRKSITQTDMFGMDEEIGSELPRTVPYIVIIIDEVADLMAACGKAVTPNISRIAAKARAAGIHLILATQRPDAKVITGTIKSNIPGRVAFKTASGIDSRTILDETGAEDLIGRGDILFKTAMGNLIRAQGALISDEEIDRVTEFIEQHSSMQLDEKLTSRLSRVKDVDPEKQFEDEEREDDAPSAAEGREAVRAAEKASNYKKALELIINDRRVSISFLQQRLGIGYNNASRLCYELEKNGVIGPQHGAGPRPILMTEEELRSLFASLSDDSPGDGGEETAVEDIATNPEDIVP